MEKEAKDAEPQAALSGEIVSFADRVATTSVTASALVQQGFRLGEPLRVDIGGKRFEGAYIGTLLPTELEELYGPGNLEGAQLAVSMAYDNRERLTVVELTPLGALADVEELSGSFSIVRGGKEVPMDGYTLAETDAPLVKGETLEVTVAAVGTVGLAILCDQEALAKIDIEPMHRLTVQVDGRRRRVLQDLPENRQHLESAREEVIRRLPGGARLLKERVRLREELAEAWADGRAAPDVKSAQRDNDMKIENMRVPPSRAQEIPLVAHAREHWDDPKTKVLVLKPIVGELMSFVIEAGQRITLRRG